MAWTDTDTDEINGTLASLRASELELVAKLDKLRQIKRSLEQINEEPPMDIDGVVMPAARRKTLKNNLIRKANVINGIT